MKEDDYMYRLYGYVEDELYGRVYSKIAEAEKELDIIKAIDEDIKTTEIISYTITKNKEPYMWLFSYEDFIDYIDQYRRLNKTRNKTR